MYKRRGRPSDDRFRSHMESWIHILVCQLRIPGLWMYAKDTATLAIEAHGAVYLYVDACVVVDMDVIRDGVTLACVDAETDAIHLELLDTPWGMYVGIYVER
jgi:hypothetical protein